MNIEVTLLSKEEVEGKSKILEKVGRGCDYDYWTSTPSLFYSWNISDEFRVTSSGELDFGNTCLRYGVRPVLKSDNLEDLIRNLKITYENGVEVVEYGQYPDLEVQFNIPNNVNLKPTGKKYYLFYYFGYLYEDLEYEYNGEKYVNKEGKYYKVKPVKFYVDRENNMLISKDVLFNAPINIDNPNYDGHFETSKLYQFLNNEFINSLKPDGEYSNDEIETLFEETPNPYNLDLEELDEEDIIEGAILSDIPVMLHGQTGDGKSARVKQIDKDTQIIYLASADPTDINGKSVQKKQSLFYTLISAIKETTSRHGLDNTKNILKLILRRNPNWYSFFSRGNRDKLKKFEIDKVIRTIKFFADNVDDEDEIIEIFIDKLYDCDEEFADIVDGFNVTDKHQEETSSNIHIDNLSLENNSVQKKQGLFYTLISAIKETTSRHGLDNTKNILKLILRRNPNWYSFFSRGNRDKLKKFEIDKVIRTIKFFADNVDDEDEIIEIFIDKLYDRDEEFADIVDGFNITDTSQTSDSLKKEEQKDFEFIMLQGNKQPVIIYRINDNQMEVFIKELIKKFGKEMVSKSIFFDYNDLIREINIEQGVQLSNTEYILKMNTNGNIMIIDGTGKIVDSFSSNSSFANSKHI